MGVGGEVGSRNRPLSTALAPASGDRDHQVARDLPVQVHAVGERRDRLGVQHGAGGGVADLHLLGSGPAVPVEEVQLQVVRLAVGEVDVDGEAGGGVPDGGDAVRRAGDLQGAGVGGGRGPGVGRLAAGRDGGVGREAGRAADDVVALRAVGADPAPLRRRVLLRNVAVAVGRRCRCRVEEQAAEHGLAPAAW